MVIFSITMSIIQPMNISLPNSSITLILELHFLTPSSIYISPDPNMFSNTTCNKSNVYGRYQCKFDRENFILNYFSIDREDLLKVDELKVDNPRQMYLEKINIFLGTYVSLLVKSKPWITLGLQKSVSIKNKLRSSLIRRVLY